MLFTCRSPLWHIILKQSFRSKSFGAELLGELEIQGLIVVLLTNFDL